MLAAMTDPSTDMVTITTPDGSTVTIPANLNFGSAGDEAPVPFAIDGEVFYAAARIPAEEHGQLAALLANMPKPDKDGKITSADAVDDIADASAKAQLMLQTVMQMVELFLMEESAERLAGRLRSKERPVDINQLMKVVTQFLNVQYAQPEGDQGSEERPTKPTSDSPAG